MKSLRLLVLLALCGCQPDSTVSAGIGMAPLTQQPGDPRRGQEVFVDRQRGHCVLCHQISSLSAEFQGNIGPSLDGVGSRLNAGQLRERIVDPTRLNPNTAMPAYHKTAGLKQVAQRYREQPVLQAQEVEDVVAYLMSLQTPTL